MSSCIENNESFSSQSFITNTTSHIIKLLPYKGTIKDSMHVKTIQPYSNTEVDNSSGRGKSLGFCYAITLQPYDSVLVTFDDTIKIPHIKWNLVYSGHGILYSSNRSISNINNWVKTITKETRHYIEGYYTFTFVEQDYIDAKNR